MNSMHAMDVITSRRNLRIVEARKLAQRKQRQRQGRFLVEGLKLLQMALDAGAQPLEAFYCPAEDNSEFGIQNSEARTALLERMSDVGADLLPVSPDVMASLAERDSTDGLLATFALFETALNTLSTAPGDLLIVLDRLQDPGNLGTIIRTADAVGAAAVILIEPCADPFDPKTVRGTMGSLFNAPLVRISDVAGLFNWLGLRELRVVAADANRGQLWGDSYWQQGAALVLGNEARGLSDDVSSHVQDWVRLPIAGQAESLNVGVAAGVLMYSWLRVHW